MKIIDFKIEKSIPVFYIEATSFPMGIKDAFDKLYSIILGNKQRNFYGISNSQNNKGIIYKACAEQIENGEAEKLSLPSMVIPEGIYYCIEVDNFKSNPMIMGEAFKTILSQANIDSNGFCLEIYDQSPDIVRCLVRKAIN